MPYLTSEELDAVRNEFRFDVSPPRANATWVREPPIKESISTELVASLLKAMYKSGGYNTKTEAHRVGAALVKTKDEARSELCDSLRDPNMKSGFAIDAIRCMVRADHEACERAKVGTDREKKPFFDAVAEAGMTLPLSPRNEKLSVKWVNLMFEIGTKAAAAELTRLCDTQGLLSFDQTVGLAEAVAARDMVTSETRKQIVDLTKNVFTKLAGNDGALHRNGREHVVGLVEREMRDLDIPVDGIVAALVSAKSGSDYFLWRAAVNFPCDETPILVAELMGSDCLELCRLGKMMKVELSLPDIVNASNLASSSLAG